MTNDEVKQIAAAAARETVKELRAAGMLKDFTARKKTEELLYQYTTLKKSDRPEAQRVVQEIEACLEEAANEPYVDVIRLYYFGGVKNTACGSILCCDERTARRARLALVDKFSVRLAPGDYIKDLLF